MIATVFIDIDDTLLDFTLCSREAIILSMNEIGEEYKESYFPVFREENAKLWKALERGELTPEGLYAIRFNTVFSCLGLSIDGPRFEKLFKANLKKTAVLMDGAEELMAYLKGKYTVCAASNAPLQQQLLRLEMAGLKDYFDYIFVSEELGFSKPKKEFFDACFSYLPGVSPKECIMIGDSLTSDILGGREYGMKTCWFNNKAKNEAVGYIDYTVTRLCDIMKIL